MYGFAISIESFGENMARGQGKIQEPSADLKSGDLFAFMVWPLETAEPVAYMRCSVGNVEDGVATWERVGSDLSKEQLESAKQNLIRYDKPIKYD